LFVEIKMHLNSYYAPQTAKISTVPRLIVELATDTASIYASQRLRYQIFAEEQGALLSSAALGIDCDDYDEFCYHLLVRHTETNEVVGSTRILTQARATQAGGFYSSNEFKFNGLFDELKGNAIEIGRTCIHPHYRNGAGIGMLWVGLAQFMRLHQVQYLFGCASVSMQDQGQQASVIMQEVRARYLAPDALRVTPIVPLLPMAVEKPHKLSMPPLLKAYLKLGAWVAGDACFDPDFKVADFFILLDLQNLNQRYHQHFMQQQLHSDLLKVA
jgi:putative hemolysin